MKLRGLARVAAVAAASFLLVGAVGAPAFADPDVPAEPEPFPMLLSNGDTTAADFKTHGCNGIADGVAKVGIDGWFFNQPVEKETVTDKDVFYEIVFETVPGQGVLLRFTSDGIASWAVSTAALAKLKSNVKAGSMKAAADGNGLTEIPLPAGVAAKAGKDGGWVQTPAGWTLLIGVLVVLLPADQPEQPEAATETEEPEPKFSLVRTCLPAPAPSASPTPPPLPVTGTNTWFVAGAGVALVAFGAVLFLLRRRRESVKFVA